MRTTSIRALVIVALIFGFTWSMLPANPPPDRSEEAQAAIVELSQHLGEKDVSDRAKKIVKEYKSDEISSIFVRKDAGGLGIGSLTQFTPQDSIERLVVQLARRKNITEAELDQYQADYTKVAKVMQAMAELAPHRGTVKIRSDEKLLKQWLDTAADFKKKTAEFRHAVEERDPKKVRTTALELRHTCCDCHGQVE
jgi:hypothetical protein